MKDADSTRDRSGLALFFAVSLLLAWSIWVPQAFEHLGLIGWSASLRSPMNALTVWAPGLAAMLVLYRQSGAKAVGGLFSQLRHWRVGVKWYVFALLFEPTRWLVALGIDRMLGRDYELGEGLLGLALGSSAAFMIPVAVIFTLPNALGEELGWRGFALPKLQHTYGAVRATVFIGVFWGAWHIPAWIAWGDAGHSWLPLCRMVVGAIPAAAIFTWLYNRTGSSLLIPVLYHASIANKGYFLPHQPTYTETALLWAIAVFLAARGEMRPDRAGQLPVNGGSSVKQSDSCMEPTPAPAPRASVAALR